MPASFHLYLRPRRPSRLNKHVGRWLNGLLYHLVAESNPHLATRMHEEMTLKPFTVSLLQGRFETRQRIPYAVPDELYRVRYTVLTDAVYAALGEVLLERYLSHRPLELGDRPFDLERIGMAPHEESPWVGTQSYEALYTSAVPARKFSLRFATPTAFKAGDLHLMFPQPWNVFGSLKRTWQTFSGIPLPEDLIEFTEPHVAVSRYQLETRVIRAGAYQLKGFMGECEYLIKGDDATYTTALGVLADFALYAGIGMKSTQGMGQARRL